MNTYIAFLRGVNVSGSNIIKMADLKECLLKEGFVQVKTYIQSGNLVFNATQTNAAAIAQLVSSLIYKNFAIKVPVLVKTIAELQAVLADNPFVGKAARKQLYFTLLLDPFQKEYGDNLVAKDYPNEDFAFGPQCLYLNCRLGAGRAKLNNNLIEKKLQVRATTRNLNTLEKLVTLAAE